MKILEVYKFIKRVFIPIVMPLAVCACSVKVDIDINEMAKMQAIITLNSTAPEIDVCENYTRDDGKRKSYIDISVLGGRTVNYKIKAIDNFLQIMFISSNFLIFNNFIIKFTQWYSIIILIIYKER